ncbi:MAG: ATP-binding protein, partial [Acidimicrobiales bacterium]
MAGRSSSPEPVGEVPYYLPVGDEVKMFEAAWEDRTPVMLRGPTGVGKTRFLEHMAARSGPAGVPLPVTTVSCHEDLTASDLVGRLALTEAGTTWLDGPLTLAVREGGICYLDEIVEARRDVTVVIHSLTDHRRLLPVAKLGTEIEAHPDFLLVISYNPGYQSFVKELK